MPQHRPTTDYQRHEDSQAFCCCLLRSMHAVVSRRYIKRYSRRISDLREFRKEAGLRLPQVAEAHDSDWLWHH